VIKVDRAIGPTAGSSIFRDVGIVLSRHGVRGATAFDGLTGIRWPDRLRVSAGLHGERRLASGVVSVLLAPARGTWPCGSGQGSERP
jgi:hypothetical protein